MSCGECQQGPKALDHLWEFIVGDADEDCGLYLLC